MESSPARDSKYVGYMMLLAVLGVAGFLAAKAAEYSNLSPFTCNFACGIFVALYALENWSLLVELNQTKALARSEALQKEALLQSERNHIEIIKELTENNKSLVLLNTTLKESIEEKHTQDRERGDEAIKCIIHWRKAWNQTDCCNHSPFSNSPYNSENSESPCITPSKPNYPTPRMNSQHSTNQKVPPITHEEPL